MVISNEKETGPLGRLGDRVSDALRSGLKPIHDEMPFSLAVVLRTAEGVAVLADTFRPLPSYDETLNVMQAAQRLLRAGADSCGRVLFQSVDDPLVVAGETAWIVGRSRELKDDYLKDNCGHERCRVRHAAMLIATGIRLLATLGVPDDSLQDLTRMCKEACRRAHLKRQESCARGSA